MLLMGVLPVFRHAIQGKSIAPNEERDAYPKVSYPASKNTAGGYRGTRCSSK